MYLIFIELNEINFDVVAEYIKSGESLPAFQKLLTEGVLETFAEQEYELIEPWIQWASVHTGKSFSEHRIFRLGDIVNSPEVQFFERIESLGFKVGAISPMNARNSLKSPAYFIPDPWTVTPSDGSYLSESVSKAISQAVNDNAKAKLTISSIFSLCIAMLVLVSVRQVFKLAVYAIGTMGHPWRKAIFLDKLLYQVHKSLQKKHNPNFSTLFLNAGAHIQHHYFLNSKVLRKTAIANPDWYISEAEDPVLEVFKSYDEMLKDLLGIERVNIIIATGLSQKPYDRVKYYYRLKEHAQFLYVIGIEFTSVEPRMTRDFLVTFDSDELALSAEKKFSSILVDGEYKLFGEIDNRGSELFVTLTYPNEITVQTSVNIANGAEKLAKHVVFVAIKNGMHQSKGFSYFSERIKQFAP
ncbi:MAG: hypothetical protein RLP12_00030, partial [Ekhidna sp.]